MNIGNNTYILSRVSLSSNPIPSNAFLTTHPPPNSRGPSGQNVATIHFHSVTVNKVVSQSRVPHVVSIGHVPIFGLSHVPTHGTPHIPNYGPSHGTSHGTPYGASHGHSYEP